MIKIAFALVTTLVLFPGAGPHTRAPAAQGTQAPQSIDSLMAPIALYPDQLLAQMLLCAQDPAALQRLQDWLKANPGLKGSELQDVVNTAGFEPHFVALALFPQVVAMMVEKLEWTTLVGQVFATDRKAVFASIQKLRAQAQTAGNLKDTPQQDIETKTTTGGEQVIVIEPANPQVVYVPQYNPTVVYTAPATTTVVVQQSSSSANAAAAGLIGFTAGIAIGAATSNNYYYGPYGWHGGGYMYNDAWDDYYDAREDAREDWQDHREDLVDERGDRAKNAQEQRTERQGNRTDTRSQTQSERTDRRTGTNSATAQSRTSGESRTSATSRTSAGSIESRGSSASQRSADRSGTKSGAFSGYSSGKSERAASSRGNQSRSASRSRSGGGGRRR